MELPLFPLHTVLYPGAPMPLHVFEERYRQMFQRVAGGGGQFGVVAITSGRETDVHVTYQPVGCVAETREVRRYPDGRLDVVARGSRRFQVERVVQREPFVVAEVQLLEEREGEVPAGRLATAGELFGEYLSTLLKIVDDPPPEVTTASHTEAGTAAPERDAGRRLRLPGGKSILVPANPVTASYLFASSLRLDLPDKQGLLVAATAADRLYQEVRLFRREIALLRHSLTKPPFRTIGPFSLN